LADLLERHIQLFDVESSLEDRELLIQKLLQVISEPEPVPSPGSASSPLPSHPKANGVNKSSKVHSSPEVKRGRDRPRTVQDPATPPRGKSKSLQDGFRTPSPTRSHRAKKGGLHCSPQPCQYRRWAHVDTFLP
jgi:hypothetical protein